jgi:hypothetical protein
MCIASYVLGQKHYPVPYQIVSYLINIIAAIAIWFLVEHFSVDLNTLLTEGLHLLGIGLLLLIIWIQQPKVKIH